MFPTITLLGKTIGTYTLAAIAGGLIAGAWACRTARARGHDDNDMIALLLVSALGIILGGHVLYALVNYDALLRLIATFPAGFSGATLGAAFGGSVFFGGLLGGLGAGLLFAAKRKLPLGEYSDMAAPIAPLFHAFGRIGCFLGGCCYGVESAFGFSFTHALAAHANGVRRFPVQLCEAVCNALLFLLLSHLLKRKTLRGALMALYLLLYSVLRFGLEFLRGDEVRGFWGPLSTSQWISIVLFTCAAAFLIKRAFIASHSAAPAA